MAKYNVRKANHLIEIEERMSKSAQLWVSYLVACLPKAQEGIDDFPTLEFSFKEIKNMINADGKKRVGKVMDVHKLNKELMSIPLWYESEERAGYVSWLTDAFLDKKSKEKRFIFRFHPGLKPYLLNLKQHYTYYNFFYRVCLSKNSMKFYEILKSKQYLKEKYKRSIELNIEDDIKYPLGLIGKYDKYYDFRRKVLDVCQKELEKFTDIRFTYEPCKKEWNRVVSILINIERNVPKSLPEPIMKYMVEGLDMSSKTLTLF
ncbi:MAG: replication initiation protein, partial [Saprospiraceae bacterium]